VDLKRLGWSLFAAGGNDDVDEIVGALNGLSSVSFREVRTAKCSTPCGKTHTVARRWLPRPIGQELIRHT
jgi:hypothetical protein